MNLKEQPDVCVLGHVTHDEVQCNGDGQQMDFVFHAERKKRGSDNRSYANYHEKILKPASFGERTLTEELLHGVNLFSQNWVADGFVMKVDFRPEGALRSLSACCTNSVVLYFMGRRMPTQGLWDWAGAVFGSRNEVQCFTAVGKGFYVATCTSEQAVQDLVIRGGVWGASFFAYAMPWTPEFDPNEEIMHYCPVWITLKNLPLWLHDHVHAIASTLGRVLFIPKMQRMRSGLDVKVCVLWNMDRPIPKFVDLNMGNFGAYRQELAFASFPNACYKCRSIGHYARNCPMAANVLKSVVKNTWKCVDRDPKVPTVDSTCLPKETVSGMDGVENGVTVDMVENAVTVDMVENAVSVDESPHLAKLQEEKRESSDSIHETLLSTERQQQADAVLRTQEQVDTGGGSFGFQIDLLSHMVTVSESSKKSTLGKKKTKRKK